MDFGVLMLRQLFIVAFCGWLALPPSFGANCTLALGANNPRSLSGTGGLWTGTGCTGGSFIPAAGDTAAITGSGTSALTVDQDWPLGVDYVNGTAGTGTITTSGVNVTGSGTAFTTELTIGDNIAFTPSRQFTVITITDDTHLTIGTNNTQASGVAFTIRKKALFTNAVPITVNSSRAVTLKGDFPIKGAIVTMAAGSSLLFDGTAATQNYRVWLGAGEGSNYPAQLAASGSSGSHVVIRAVNGSPYATIEDSSFASGIDTTYVDYNTLGNASVVSVSAAPQTSPRKFKMDHCTFTNMGAIRSSTTGASVALAADFVFTNNTLVSVPSGASALYDYFLFNFTAGTPSGLRTITGNALALADQDTRMALGVSNIATISNNVLSRVGTQANAGNLQAFSNNLIYKRKLDSTAGGWSFVGLYGDTLTGNYVINDEGNGQENEHQLMANDAIGNAAGIWRMTQGIFERTGRAATPFHISHPSGPTNAGTYLYDYMLALPDYTGQAPGSITMRGTANTTVKVSHNTLMGSAYDRGNNTFVGAVFAGVSYAGFAGMIDNLSDNINWQKAAWSGVGTNGFLASVYDSGAGHVANILNAANVLNNAHYNATTGTLYDAAGANGTSALGYQGWKQGTKPTLATDINLGTGSDERTKGPRFVDSTRNLATFDTAYLGNSASAWQDAHAYAVGDIVSASTSTFYNSATINFRCVSAHTSDAASATNGKPGSAVTITSTAPLSGYRTRWEFASVQRIRDAQVAATPRTDAAIGCASCDYIQTLSAWVRKGFTPQNPSLWCSAGDAISSRGAVNFCANGKAMLGAIASQ